jgi:hypothetical protein
MLSEKSGLAIVTLNGMEGGQPEEYRKISLNV